MPQTDAEIITRMQSFFDALEAECAVPVANATEAEGADHVRRMAATATQLIDDLTATRPGACLERPLSLFVADLTAYRDAARTVLNAPTSGRAMSDEDYTGVLGGILGMGQAVEDAKESCAPIPS